MSPLTQFSSPAYLTDFTPENAKRWSTEYVSSRITREANVPGVSQFYNELTSNWTETPERADITWVAFPNRVRDEEGSDVRRWRRADAKGEQDEYCEWTVQRNENGKIVRVVFTAEGPEYWDWLAKMQPDTVLKLYKEHNPGFDIKKEDLFSPDGTYNRDNKWNHTTPGSIMHLRHRNNTLGAQFHLAGQSTVLRMDSNGKPIRESDRLILCSRLGGPTRNSDPHIGIEINNLAHQKMLITVADPVGLYLHRFNGSSFHAPDGANVQEFWKWTRGTPADPEKGTEDNWVRAVFEVPQEKGYVVGDIEDQNGNKIDWGSQLADRIQVRLTGQVIRAGLHAAQMYHCISPNPTKKFMSPSEKENLDEQAYVDEDGYECDRAGGVVDAGWSCY